MIGHAAADVREDLGGGPAAPDRRHSEHRTVVVGDDQLFPGLFNLPKILEHLRFERALRDLHPAIVTLVMTMVNMPPTEAGAARVLLEVTYRHMRGMPSRVRTTLRLDDSLLDAARAHARERGETLTAVFERALRVYLARASSPAPVEAPPLPTFRGRGLQPGVDLDDTAALEDRMRDG